MVTLLAAPPQTLQAPSPHSSTVPLETIGPFARGKTSSLPNVIAANSQLWDENYRRGKDESNRNLQ